MRQAFVIGSPIAHSISPAIHNAAFSALGIDAQYQAVEVAPADLGAWVAGVSQPGLLGFNVTVPHKEAITAHLTSVEADARLARAVNTVVARPSGEPTQARQLVGFNTDTEGFRRSLSEEAGVTLQGRRVVVLGAGGAARAVALVALREGASHLVVANRHQERADQLLRDLSPTGGGALRVALSLTHPRLPGLLAAADVVINATSVGLRGGEVPIDPALLPDRGLVVDLVYNPRRTDFLAGAAERGASTLSGLGMLVFQAAAAFELWTAHAAPVAVMRAAAEHALAEMNALSS